MSAKPSPERPLSPFMIGPYYRPQLTSMLSILHRITGVINTVGAFLLSGWLLSIASGPAAYDAFMGHASAWYGLFFLFGWTWTVALALWIRDCGVLALACCLTDHALRLAAGTA